MMLALGRGYWHSVARGKKSIGIEVEAAVVGEKGLALASELVPLGTREHVERIATRKITGFLGTIDEDGEYYNSVHKQNQSLSQHIIADYHGRFPIELIQNGHDAHDAECRDGEISVLVASDEGESGTLYGANRGKPFQPKNVDAFCEMGLSSKPIWDRRRARNSPFGFDDEESRNSKIIIALRRGRGGMVARPARYNGVNNRLLPR
jgi:hypothetical protein